MNKEYKILLLPGLFIGLIIVIGTYAWLSWSSNDTAMVLTIGDINGLTITLKPYQINDTLLPVNDYADGIVVDVTADNRKAEADNFRLFYKIDTIDNALLDSSFKYTITKCTANCDMASNYTLLNDSDGNFANASSDSNLTIYQENVPANTTYKYRVYLWIDSSAGNQSNMQNKSFVGELRASVSLSPYKIMQDNAVMDNVKSRYVTATTGINFNANSSDTNGKGIYIRSGTENDSYPIYYYRGEVDDNNVLFAGFCWKIVRTTSTGGTKLIYNGIPTNNECNNTGTDAQLPTTSKFNNNSSSLADAGYMYGTRYTYSNKTMTNITDSYLYGNNYTYNNGTYTLVDTISFAGTDLSSNYKRLNDYHYTCLSTAGICDKLYFIYRVENPRIFYITIAAGKTISEMLDEMLTSSSNENPSAIKTAIDVWYESNITSYTSKLEDTPWCNDRTIASLAGWNPNGGSVFSGVLTFSGFNYINLNCSINDAFTLPGNKLGNGKLQYPVGLLTAAEARLGGCSGNFSNSSYYLCTGVIWWLGSSMGNGGQSTRGSVINQNGSNTNAITTNSLGVRPAVSLKYGTKFSDGDGSATNPYVVE